MSATNITKSKNTTYVLAVLFVVMMLNFIDRKIVSILAEPVKRDIGLSDSQIGLMTGLSFAILLSIPLAAIADRWNQSKIAFSFFYGLCFSNLQLLATNRTRALTMAIWLFFSGLVGLVLGPLFVGILSDMFSAGVPVADGLALQKAIVTIGFFTAFAALHFVLAKRRLKIDLAES